MSNKEKEFKEWDDAILDLVNKGLIKISNKEDGEKGFIINPELADD
jgi:hypothetical protein